MKRLIILLLQAALVAGIVGATYFYTESRTKPAGVLVFNRNVPRHTKINDSMISVVTVPESAVSKIMARDIKEVLGKYTGADAAGGEPVFTAKLLDEKSLAPEYLMREDMRKQSFEVDLARSNGGALKPGDYVDLLYYIEDSAAGTARSDFFIRKILVLDVRNSEAVPLNNPGQGAGEEGFSSGIGKRIPAVITVAVTPEQVKQIVFYKNRGKIDIAVYPENAFGRQTAGGTVAAQPIGGPSAGQPAKDTATPVNAAVKPAAAAVKPATAADEITPKRIVPDYRTVPNVALPGKVDNGRNR